jgi:peptidoglycan hydrolase CwlO-like protein
VCLLLGADAGWSQRASLEERINSQQEQIKKIEKDIKKHRSKSQALRQEETNVLKQLSSLEQEIALSRQFLGSLVERQALLEEKIDSLEANIVFESEILNYQRKKLSLRLRQMYMRGPSYSWDILLGSGDIEVMLRRYKFLKLVAERDADLIERVTVNKLVLERERAEKTETLADIAVLRTRKQEEDGRLQKSKKDRKSALKRVRSEKSQHLQAIEELKRSQEKLMELISDLEKRRLEKKDIGELDGSRFARLRGSSPGPSRGRSSSILEKTATPNSEQ